MAPEFAGMQVLEKLGQTATAALFRAWQPRLNRTVALKVLNPAVAPPKDFQRLQREAAVLEKLRHPNIVRLLTLGRDTENCYFTMEFIEGRLLSDLIQAAETAAELSALVRHVATLARAVHYAHTQGVIHRNLNPADIVVDAEGRPVITDFAFGKELDAGQTITVTGAVVGTAGYMPPEQASHDTEAAGPASDVYGLGAILYEILTKRPPFQGPTLAAVVEEVAQRPPVAPHTFDRTVPRDVEAICLKCLAKRPGKRYPTAKALAEDLERHLAGERVMAAHRRGRRLPAIGLGLLTAVLHLWVLLYPRTYLFSTTAARDLFRDYGIPLPLATEQSIRLHTFVRSYSYLVFLFDALLFFLLWRRAGRLWALLWTGWRMTVGLALAAFHFFAAKMPLGRLTGRIPGAAPAGWSARRAEALFFVFLVLAAFALLAFWVWALRDAIRSERKGGPHQIVWLLIVLIGGVAGALLYLLVRRPQREGLVRASPFWRWLGRLILGPVRRSAAG